jgi:site-specific recombinase XerD
MVNRQGEHASFFKTLEDVKEYLHPGGVKFYLLEAEPLLKEHYKIDNPNLKAKMMMAIISVMYLCGSRVCEIPEIKMNHLRVFKENNIWYLRMKTKNGKNPRRHSKVITVSYSTPHDRTFIKKVTAWFKWVYNYHDFEEITGYTYKEALLGKYKSDEDKVKSISLLNEKYLFSHDIANNRIMSTSAIQKPIQSTLKCNTHFIRKLRASMLVDYFGANPRQIQEYLGHADTSSAAVYLALSQRNLKELVSNKDFV